jgi:hypothetical protein
MRIRLAVLLTALVLPTSATAQSPSPGTGDIESGSSGSALRRAVCPSVHGGSCLGPLTAGTYTTLEFQTPLTYTVPDGWANFEDLSGNFLLIPPGGSNDGVDAGTSDYIGVYQGAALAAADCSPRIEAGVGTTSADLAAGLAMREGLIVTEPVDVVIGGLTGAMIDIALDPSSEAGCVIPELQLRIVPLTIGVAPASLEHAQFDGFTTRLIFLDHPDGTIAIEVSDVTASPGTTAEYEPVIASMRFGSRHLEP